MYRTTIQRAPAGLAILLAVLGAAAIADEPTSVSQDVLGRLVKAARLEHNPWPEEISQWRKEADIPGDFRAILAGETPLHCGLYYGFQDDHGWPMLAWHISSLYIHYGKGDVDARLKGRIKKLGYGPTPHPPCYDYAFHRRDADADFIVMFTESKRHWHKVEGEVIAQIEKITILIRSTSRRALPTYAEAIRALPSLEPNRELQTAFPPSVFKTIIRWPVLSLMVTDEGDSITMSFPIPNSKMMFEQGPMSVDLLKDIPDACVGAGYKRQEAANKEWAKAVAVSKSWPNDKPWERYSAYLEIRKSFRTSEIGLSASISRNPPPRTGGIRPADLEQTSLKLGTGIGR